MYDDPTSKFLYSFFFEAYMQNLRSTTQLSLKQKIKVAENTYEVAFLPKDSVFAHKPGQFVHLSIPLHYDDPLGDSRDFSVASSPNDQYVRIVFRNTGSGFKRTLLEAKELEVIADTSAGSFLLPESLDKQLIFIAGGIGVTPFHSMLSYVTEEKLPYDITLLSLNKTKERIVYEEKFRALAEANKHISYRLQIGRLTEGALLQSRIAPKPALYYVAGSPQFVEVTKKILFALKVPESVIKQEDFPGY